MKVLGHELHRQDVEPGLPFRFIDPLLDLGWKGLVLWALLFPVAGVLVLGVFSWLSWLVNPPWRT
jgi:hypothetical protein